MFQKVLYYSGFIFSCYAFVFILWQNQAYKFRRFKFHTFFLIKSHHRSRGVPKLILYYEEDLHFGRNVPDRHCDSFSPEL